MTNSVSQWYLTLLNVGMPVIWLAKNGNNEQYNAANFHRQVLSIAIQLSAPGIL